MRVSVWIQPTDENALAIGTLALSVSAMSVVAFCAINSRVIHASN